jgi:ribosomal protein L11 methyltransferase
MQLYRFEINSAHLDATLLRIEQAGGTILFSSEGEEFSEIYAEIPNHAVLHGIKGEPAELPKIDWEGQWALHGVTELTIGEKTIQLEPGPGFGDYSHPTTQLMIELMKDHLQGAVVVDVGCGSGILSLAAIALGAKQVIGIDIDSAALEHSHINAQKNGFEAKCTFCLPENFNLNGEAFLLMNMISSEQKVAWQTVQKVKSSGLITSGVLQEEKEDYLRWLDQWGWRVASECEKEGWLSFYLER